MNTKLRVLLIDDDEDDFVMTRDLLKQSSEYTYDLQWAKDYDSGIEFVGREKYDVCLLDYRLGKYDGLNLLQEVIASGCKIPIIIMTGQGRHEIDMEAMKNGAADYLVKGQITAVLLERSILHAIERKEAEERLRSINQQLKSEITERKQAEESLREGRERFQKQNEFINTVLDSLIYPFYVIDACDYTIKMSNLTLRQGKLPEKATCYMVSHKRDKPCDEADHTCPLKIIKKTRKPVTVEHIQHDKDGNPRYVEVHAYPIFDREGNVSQITEYCIDITERKQTELSQNELIKKVDKINRELNDFASIVSHDLKAPLRGIKTLANWILADGADKLGDQANEQINLLLERVERMYNLIEGALQYSRLGQTKGKQIQVNLNNFVPEIINMVVPPENITVTIENELPVIEFEETRIMQVFQNLLSNAIKYMDKPKGWIKIGCVEQDGFWKFSVADNGPGIEKKHFEKIFKIFQALPTSPMFEGTGVGLTIAKKIVELYNGKIWVKSKVGRGSTFFFTLPKQKEPRLAGTKMGAKK